MLKRFNHGFMLVIFLSVFFFFVLPITPSFAQSNLESESFPIKPIRVIVPSTVGGGLDLLVRMLGAKFTQEWGQPVVVDLRSGASGIIGSEVVAKAAPDGYTLLAAAAAYALNPLLFAKLPYDTLKDFERITIMGFGPNVLVVNASFPVYSVKELIQLAKKMQGTVNFASSGTGSSSYQSAVLFMRMANIKMAHVAYKGAGASAGAVITGEVPLIFSAASNVMPMIQAKRLRPIAVTSPKRMSLFPNVATVAETLPGFEVQNFFGLLAPAKTPKSVTEKIQVSFKSFLMQNEIKDRLRDLGFVPGGETSEEFTKYVKSEMTKWAVVFKDLNMKPD